MVAGSDDRLVASQVLKGAPARSREDRVCPGRITLEVHATVAIA
jgi:hypothetical protein